MNATANGPLPILTYSNCPFYAVLHESHFSCDIIWVTDPSIPYHGILGGKKVIISSRSEVKGVLIAGPKIGINIESKIINVIITEHNTANLLVINLL